ncbi:dynactin subunit 6-like [Condylostylus longicornis]|uniref:dynactin subunit 6-like n=1 Tax=Condylostylus longicornis TaxID=2530218 RepID=UPI00244E2A98|nr:dynactin subunit 6-like [Condylostylus longicornis]
MEDGLKIMPRAIVCYDIVTKGDITISSGCVIQPSVTIIAESGPIFFGENCIVEEYSTIIFKVPEHLKDENNTPMLNIGSNNVFEVGCTVKALKIGDKNVFECKSFVSDEVEVSSGCVIGAGCRLEGKYKLAENTVVYGKNCLMRECLEKPTLQILQIDYLRRVLPNYHHLKRHTGSQKAQEKIIPQK